MLMEGSALYIHGSQLGKGRQGPLGMRRHSWRGMEAVGGDAVTTCGRMNKKTIEDVIPWELSSPSETGNMEIA